VKSTKYLIPLAIIIGFIIPHTSSAQARLDSLEVQLKRLSETTIPSLKSNISTSVSGVSIQEFLRGVASTNKLNLNVDPTLTIKITNNFTNISTYDLLVFLCRQHQLTIDFYGSSILSIKKATPENTFSRYVSISEKISSDSLRKTLTLDLKNDSIEKIARRITELTGKNIVLMPGVSDLLITLYAKNVSLDNAIDKMALTNNLRVTKGDDQSFIIEKRDPQQTTLTKNYSLGGNLAVKLEKDSLGVLSLITFEAHNVPIADLIKDLSRKLGINYFLYVEPKGTITLALSKMNFEDVVRYLFKGTDYTITKEGAILFNWRQKN